MNQKGQSRLDTVLKLLLIGFISLLAFSSGVYFGKEMSDSDYKVKALESDFQHTTQEASHEEGNKHEDALVDEEVNQLADKYQKEAKEEKQERGVASENDEKKPEAKGHGGHEEENTHGKKETAKHDNEDDGHGTTKTATKPTDKHGESDDNHHDAKETAKNEVHGKEAAHGESNTATHTAARHVANNENPTEPAHHQEEGAPKSLPRTVGSVADFEYTVQVAAFPSEKEAKANAEKLVAKGMPAGIFEANVNGKTWYRVSLGSFKTKKEANDYKSTIVKQDDFKSAIVQQVKK